jgi:hypothetical protein
VHFDDLVNGLRCEDSLVAVPKFNPNLLSGFSRDTLGQQSAELYLKAPGMIGKASFCEILERFVRARGERLGPLIEWCTEMTSLNDR